MKGDIFMNKKSLVFLLTALILCSCSSEEPAELETFPDITAVESVSDTSAEISETETEKETETSSETVTETETEPGISETETSADADESFSLADLAGDFDAADPMRYTLVTKENFTPADKKSAENAALEVVRESDFLRSAEKQAREMFTYENGVYTPTDEMHFLNSTYLDYLGDDFSIEPKPIGGITAKFDGVNDGYVYFFSMPLSFDYLEWSGAFELYAAVFVNDADEAQLICGDQTLGSAVLLAYEDRTDIAFSAGHTSGTSHSYIVSFNDRAVLTNRRIYGSVNADESGYVLKDDVTGFLGQYELFFRDRERGYCGISAVKLSDDAFEKIKNYPGIQPDERNADEFDADHFYIAGGKYLKNSFDAYAYVFDGNDLVPTDFNVIAADEDDFDTVLNVNISEWE